MRTEDHEYWKLFKPSACSVKLKAGSQEDVFQEVVGNLVKAKALSGDLVKAAVKALMDREAAASTGVGQNVAIPHVKLGGLEEVVLSLSVHSEGIEWRSLDGLPVHLLFTVLRPTQPGPKHDPERHLELMRWISQLGRAPDFRRFAIAASNRTELVDLMKEMSAKIG